jgi:hypothetical protein
MVPASFADPLDAFIPATGDNPMTLHEQAEAMADR